MSQEEEVSPHIQYRDERIQHEREMLLTALQEKEARIARFNASRVFPGLRNGNNPSILRIRKKKKKTLDMGMNQSYLSSQQQQQQQQQQQGPKRRGGVTKTNKPAQIMPRQQLLDKTKVYDRKQQHTQSQMTPRARLKKIQENSKRSKPKPFLASNTAAAKEAMYKPIIGGLCHYPYEEEIEIEKARIRAREQMRISQEPFVAGSVRGVQELTAVDYYLNSPDEAVKRAEKEVILQIARMNQQELFYTLRERQLSERAERMRAAEAEYDF